MLVHFSSCIRKGKGQWGFSYVPVEFPIESIALRIAPWSPRMSCLNFVKVCFHPSRIMILPAKTQKKITAKPTQTVLPLEMFCKISSHFAAIAFDKFDRNSRYGQMMADGRDKARHLAQTLGARADGAGLVAEALDSNRFHRSGHAKTP